MNRNDKNLTWNIPFFSLGTIFFGVSAENFTASAKQYTAFVKFLNGAVDLSDEVVKSLPNTTETSADEAKDLNHEHKRLGLQSKESKPEIKIFTFGLFLLAVDSRFRAGFIKRRQILIEA